jgi:VWFA-related protein
MSFKVHQRKAHGHVLRLLMLLAILAASTELSRAQDSSTAASPGNPPAEHTQGIPAETQTAKHNGPAKPEVSMEDTGVTFKLRVNLVQVHVVVRDGAGKPVGGLRKEDFQLYDNNKLQAISTFAIEDAQSRRERTEAAAKTQLDNGGTNAQAPGTVPERFIALAFDDVHLLTGDVAPMRAAANGFIDLLGPSDRVGVFTTSGVVTQDFTSNKDLLKQALLKLMSRAHTGGHPGACPDVSYDMAVEVENRGNTISTAGAPDLSVSAAFTILYEQTLACAPGLSPSAAANLVSSEVRRVADEGEAENRNVYRELQGMLRLLSSKPGERVLLLASPGFPIGQLTNESSELVDHASRSNIVINTIDARGLYTPDLFGDISEPYLQPAQMAGQASGVGVQIQMEKQFVLGDFAYGTGGRFFHNSNDLEGGLKQLGIAPEISYVLGFSPQMQKMDGKYHALKVKLAEKQKCTVQARRGYFAPKKLDDPQEMAKQEIQEAVFSRDEIDEVPLSLQTQYFNAGESGTRLSVVSHLVLDGLHFRKAAGRNFDDLTVATVVFDENGNFIAGGEKLVKLRLLDATIAKMSLTGFTVKSTFDVKPGKYMIRQVVRDSEGAQMAARNGTVVIPY